MTVIVRPSGGRWAGVDYVGNRSVTGTQSAERDMVNGGFAKWAPGFGDDLLINLQARVTSSGVETIEDPNTPGAAMQSSGGSGSGGYPSYTGMVATKLRFPNYTLAGTPQCMSRSKHMLTDTVSGIVLVYTNTYVSGASNVTVDGLEKSPAGTQTIRASVEYPSGTITPVTFSGSDTGTNPQSSLLVSDPVKLSGAARTSLWVRTWQQNPAGVVLTNAVPCEEGDGYVAGGADLTAGGAVTQAGSTIYRPVLILGKTTRGTVFIIGDSIANGQGDAVDTYTDVGMFTRPLVNAGIAYCNAAIGSDRAMWFLSSYAQRLAVASLAKPTHVYSNFGYNDIGNSRTMAQVTADLASIAALFPSPIRFFQSEPTPTQVTSTDMFATDTGQSFTASRHATRQGVISALRKSKIAGVYGVIRPSAYESSDLSGKWAVEPNGRVVSDYAITAGANVLTSATAAFTEADDYKALRALGAGASGGNIQTIMRYVNATTVNLTSDGTAAFNASTTVSGGTAYVSCGRMTLDGTHPTAEANRLLLLTGAVQHALP